MHVLTEKSILVNVTNILNILCAEMTWSFMAKTLSNLIFKYWQQLVFFAFFVLFLFCLIVFSSIFLFSFFYFLHFSILYILRLFFFIIWFSYFNKCVSTCVYIYICMYMYVSVCVFRYSLFRCLENVSVCYIEKPQYGLEIKNSYRYSMVHKSLPLRRLCLCIVLIWMFYIIVFTFCLVCEVVTVFFFVLIFMCIYTLAFVTIFIYISSCYNISSNMIRVFIFCSGSCLTFIYIKTIYLPTNLVLPEW